jgi:hypothetical protein
MGETVHRILAGICGGCPFGERGMRLTQRLIKWSEAAGMRKAESDFELYPVANFYNRFSDCAITVDVC